MMLAVTDVIFAIGGKRKKPVLHTNLGDNTPK